MNKNRKEMNKKIFDNIRLRLDFANAPYSAGDRWINLGSDRAGELEYYKSINLLSRKESPHIRWMRISTEFNDVIIFQGPHADLENNFDCRDLRPIEMIVFLYVMNILPITSVSETINAFELGSSVSDGYTGHECSVIARLYDPIYAIDIRDTSKCTSYILGDLLSNYSFGVSSKINSLFISYYKNRNYISCECEEARLNSLLHGGLLQQFMSLSWLLEQDFGTTAVKDLHSKLNTEMDIKNFYRTIESELDWRSKELPALCKIIKASLSTTAIENFVLDILIHQNSIDIPDNYIDFIARNLYKIRNGIVHSRSHEDPMSKLDIDFYSSILLKITDYMNIAGATTRCVCGSKTDSA